MRLSEVEYNKLIGKTSVKKETKNKKMANKGMGFEKEIEYINIIYEEKGIALIQKISTPWQVIRRGKQIVSAFPTGKSTLDFRGTVKGGTSISFDCKETKEEKGLPLANITEHQIEYIRKALEVGEHSFILCYVVPTGQRFRIEGNVVLHYWDLWQENKGKRGYNTILVKDMEELEYVNLKLDYLNKLG